MDFNCDTVTILLVLIHFQSKSWNRYSNSFHDVISIGKETTFGLRSNTPKMCVFMFPFPSKQKLMTVYEWNRLKIDLYWLIILILLRFYVNGNIFYAIVNKMRNKNNKQIAIEKWVGVGVDSVVSWCVGQFNPFSFSFISRLHNYIVQNW